MGRDESEKQNDQNGKVGDYGNLPSEISVRETKDLIDSEWMNW